MNLKQSLGFSQHQEAEERDRLLRYINLQLVANGWPSVLEEGEAEFVQIARGLLDRHRELMRRLQSTRCPVDARIEAFLQSHFSGLDLDSDLRLPGQTFVLDRHGIARELSLPVDGNMFQNDLLTSYRVKNGVLHNPINDRRTTTGTFHVCEGGLPIAGDKYSVPQRTFAELFKRSFCPPEEMLLLPFTSSKEEPAHAFVSLLLRPLVCPEVPGVTSRKTMEVRFFVPGSFVSNLDFVESIFGNAGDPFLPENDAGLDVEHWTGHTGCVILAPHLTKVTKKEVGLPHFDEATPRQRQDGMCWQDESERYNNGSPFKLTCRTEDGVIVTMIADNYFGYCKKEVKTQISYAANLFGNVEEEHSGGAIAFPSFNLGEEFQVDSKRYNNRTFADVARDYGDKIDIQPEGYAIDKEFSELIYIPENALASVQRQRIEWTRGKTNESIPLLPGRVYMAPSGYKLQLQKHPAAPSWRLIGTVGEGVFCHKPCTVSGGGKSEISKSLVDYMLYGPIFVANLESDLEYVEEIFAKDYGSRWNDNSSVTPDYAAQPSRSVLSLDRSLGSVIKLLSPSPDYTDEYNEWLHSIPNHIYAIVLIIKRFQRAEWSGDWRRYFNVDIVNGDPGHELKFGERALVGTYLRVGLQGPQSWRTFKLRQDFAAAAKIQTEDDISASVVVPARLVNDLPKGEFDDATSVKFVENCEYRLFQRPDDAVHRGLDKQTEADLTRPDNFLSNYEPLTRGDVEEMTEYVVDFDAFSPPMQQLLRSFEESRDEFVVCSAIPREIDGRFSKNPRYLQNRPDLARPFDRYVAQRGIQLRRGIASNQPLHTPVNAVLFGRRNNPADPAQSIRGLAVYNPIHYQELPELFMDFVCSLTGKSPSTTGFGSEGALTKGPFNALRFTADLNTALVSFIVTGLAGFSSAAGHIGPNMQVDHDISLLIPEIWCRLSAEERDPSYLIKEGLLERLEDFEHNGETILASRLGYRINHRFVRRFFGRVFDNPTKVFDESLLRPETQDPEAFADGIKYVTEAHQQVAHGYIDDASIDEACPPLHALIHIMAHGQFEGMTITDERLRSMFTPESLFSSDWYRKRITTKQTRDIALWQRHADYLEAYSQDAGHTKIVERLRLEERQRYAKEQLIAAQTVQYVDSLVGTLGVEPSTLRSV
ncbi:MAG: hypothetical protein H8E66_31200 [Planctomycetes bacterium]|nr:hypothetical protein [Planctomycetota bacterium]